MILNMQELKDFISWYEKNVEESDVKLKECNLGFKEKGVEEIKTIFNIHVYDPGECIVIENGNKKELAKPDFQLIFTLG